MYIDKIFSISLPALFENTVIIACCITMFSQDKYILRCLIAAASPQHATIRLYKNLYYSKSKTATRFGPTRQLSAGRVFRNVNNKII